MDPKIKSILAELPKTSYGQALKIFLDDQYAEINDVTDIQTIEDAKAKQIALKMLRKIFDFYGPPPVGKVKRTGYN